MKIGHIRFVMVTIGLYYEDELLNPMQSKAIVCRRFYRIMQIGEEILCNNKLVIADKENNIHEVGQTVTTLGPVNGDFNIFTITEIMEKTADQNRFDELDNLFKSSEAWVQTDKSIGHGEAIALCKAVAPPPVEEEGKEESEEKSHVAHA